MYFGCLWRWIPSLKGCAIELTKTGDWHLAQAVFLSRLQALIIKLPMLTAPCRDHTSYLVLTSTSHSTKCNFSVEILHISLRNKQRSHLILHFIRHTISRDLSTSAKAPKLSSAKKGHQ